MPLDMVDACLCMGAGITMAQGFHRVEPDAAHFAFIGDSTFFHAGMPGVLNAVYNRADIIIAVLDNSTTAMTGGQPHPGTGETLTGGGARKAVIYDVLKALGVDSVERVDAFDLSASEAAAARAMAARGVRAIIFEGACVFPSRGRREPCAVNPEKCVGCAACVREPGCPALAPRGEKPAIDAASCTGCGLCKSFCKFGAIEGGTRP
jgi:indolepyruvate ferredoxin oxidoreductase alpha subunit